MGETRLPTKQFLLFEKQILYTTICLPKSILFKRFFMSLFRKNIKESVSLRFIQHVQFSVFNQTRSLCITLIKSSYIKRTSRVSNYSECLRTFIVILSPSCESFFTGDATAEVCFNCVATSVLSLLLLSST